jgi:hypothetical protein
LAAQGEPNRYGRVEMRTGKGAEYQDQDSKDRAGRQRIAEQRKRVIARELLRHDAGADHGREQKCRPQPFAKCALRQRRHQLGSFTFAVAPSMRPICLSRCCRLS